MAEMNKEFQDLYDSLKTSLGGDEATLRANLEAALRPMYEQSRAQLEEQRRANNAAIDVDANSRGMGNSTWVTDAKLQQLRGLNSSLASLEANYNNQLFTQLQNALQDRDNTAWQRAMQMYQLNHKGGSGSGASGTPLDLSEYDKSIVTDTVPSDLGNIFKVTKGTNTNRAIVNPWNLTALREKIGQYTK